MVKRFAPSSTAVACRPRSCLCRRNLVHPRPARMHLLELVARRCVSWRSIRRHRIRRMSRSLKSTPTASNCSASSAISAAMPIERGRLRETPTKRRHIASSRRIGGSVVGIAVDDLSMPQARKPVRRLSRLARSGGAGELAVARRLVRFMYPPSHGEWRPRNSASPTAYALDDLWSFRHLRDTAATIAIFRKILAERRFERHFTNSARFPFSARIGLSDFCERVETMLR